MNSRIPGPCPHTLTGICKKDSKMKAGEKKQKEIKKREVTFEDVVTFEGDEFKTDQTDKVETFSKNEVISDLQKRVEDRIKKLELPKISVEGLEAENEALRQRVSALEARSNELLHELSYAKVY